MKFSIRRKFKVIDVTISFKILIFSISISKLGKFKTDYATDFCSKRLRGVFNDGEIYETSSIFALYRNGIPEGK